LRRTTFRAKSAKCTARPSPEYLNQKILPLDISQATEFVEQRLRKRVAARPVDFAHRIRGKNDSDALSFLLCASVARGGNGHGNGQ
jgi:hypothetical protein